MTCWSAFACIHAIFFTCVIIVVAEESTSASKVVSVTLTTEWQLTLSPSHHTGHRFSKATSSLLEAAEFFADEGDDQYWAFVEDWNESGEKDCQGNVYEYLERRAASEETLKVLKLSLSVRNYSPRLEMFRSLWSSTITAVKRTDGEKETAGCCLVMVGDKFARTKEELASLLATTSSGTPTAGRQATRLDHIYPGKASIPSSRRIFDSTQVFTSIPIVTFYGAMGTPCFGHFHALLKSASAQGQVHYVHRPVIMNAECARKGCIGLGTHVDTIGIDGNVGRLHVVGYGVELAVKNMEYKASDDSIMNDIGALLLAPIASESHDSLAFEVVKGFNFSRLNYRYPELNRELTSFRHYLVGKTAEDETLKIWDIKDLGLQATQRILLADDPFQMMMDISQNFPSLASSLSRLDLDSTICAEIENNQKHVSPGSLFMSINSEPIELDTVDIFTLADKITSEIREAARFRDIGLGSTAVRELLRLRIAPPGSELNFPRLNLFDSTTVPIISFNKNIESDRNYAHWSPDIMQLMRHSQLGQVPPVRRNMFNVILILNLGQSNSWRLVDALHEYTRAGVPLRLAYVLVDDSEGDTVKELWNPTSFLTDFAEFEEKEELDINFPRGLSLGTVIGRAGNLILRRFGGEAQVDFVNEVANARGVMFPGNHFIPAVKSKVTWSLVQKAFTRIFIQWYSKVDSVDSDDLVAPDMTKVHSLIDAHVANILSLAGATESEPGAYLSEAKALIADKGVAAPSALVNGIYFTLDDAERLGAEMEQVVMHFVQQEANSIAEAVLSGVLSNEILDKYPGGIFGWLHRTAVAKNTPFIVDNVKYPPTYVEMRPPQDNSEGLLAYIENCDVKASKGNTLWVVADAGTRKGMDLIASACECAARTRADGESTNSRVAVLHPPGVVATHRARAVALVSRWKAGYYCGNYSTFLSEILSSDAPETIKSALSALGMEQYASDSGMDDEELNTLLEQQGNFVASLIGMDANDSSESGTDSIVIANGRVIQIPTGYHMDADDFALLISKESSARGATVRNILESHSPVIPVSSSFNIFDQYMIACSLVAIRQTKSVSRSQVRTLESLESKHSAVIVQGDGVVVMDAVLDPLSKEAQRIAPLFYVLRDALFPHISIRIILNPRRELMEIPIKSYFRYAAPNPSLDAIPRVHFSQLPHHQTLTAHLDVPEAWLVTTVVATYDLDNLKLSDLPEEQDTMDAEYRIEALLVTGYCSESGAKDPPRGTQLILGDAGTVVMSNLGYFQLPAAPGVFELSLRPGRSADMYVFAEHVESTNSDVLLTVKEEHSARDVTYSSVEIIVSSWQGMTTQISLQRRPGMEREDVLPIHRGKDKDGGLWNKIISKWRNAKRSRLETINVFSVASGHLYERFLKIMMLSVRRNTNNPVKFWFIKNWLSPQFKDILPHIAAKYGFEYELVTYKWPTWLHKQTEKQRIIWAYKLLFLDVLFPLTLNKVIFVDADQVVRSNLKELWEMDLRGAPYAYTPFCDNNPEMEGYRFWKHGFWQTHLAGKPYHISALYVVDLETFRHTAAGDKLRLIYETLSKDPSSLANLDQDLPNYAQHQVPIFTLPQQWLWCESWCGNDTKTAAKTIDLCNNPMTKEPKLIGAARIVEEWTSLDEEVRSFTKQLEEHLLADKYVFTPPVRALS